MFHERLQNICSHKGQVIEKRKNKLCQITTPNENIMYYHGVSTDTTSDRPCCCALKLQENIKRTFERECVGNVVSEQVPPPLLLKQGQNGDGNRRFPKVNVIQQASFVSYKRGPTPVAPCLGYTGCHQSDMPQAPCDTDILSPCCGPIHSQMHEQFCDENKSEIVERKNEKQSEPCQCSPEKIKEMFEEVLRGKAKVNLKTTGCGGAEVQSTIQSIDQSSQKSKSSLKYSYNTNEAIEHGHKSSIRGEINTCNDIISEKRCGNYINQNINGNLKCACSGRERTVKIGSLCPCEQYPPPVSMTTFGPKMGTRSMGCQCCCCDDSMVKAIPGSEKLDPASGVCKMEKGGTSCQAGRRISKGCPCASNGKIGKKNKNVICECPAWIPETVSENNRVSEYNSVFQHHPVSEYEYDADIEAYVNQYHSFQSYQWVDEKLILRQKSDMTQTQSGFKIIKKKKPEELNTESEVEEYTMEDAVRYYVVMNPDIIKEYCPTPPEPNDCPCEDLRIKKSRKSIFTRNHEVQCECPPSPTSDVRVSGGTLARTTNRTPTSRVTPAALEPEPLPEPKREPLPEPKPEDEIPSGGIKFSIGGKGSGSKGLTGVCCFDMIQETKISRSQHTKNI